MIPVYEFLKKSLWKLRPICDMVAMWVYYPITAGRPLPDLSTRPRGLPIEELLQGFEAVLLKQEKSDEDVNIILPQTHQ